MLSKRKVLSTEEFAKKVLEMECCKFNFNVELSDVLFTLTKMVLGTKLLVILMNEYQDRDDGSNYSMAFAIEGYGNELGEGEIYNEKLALKMTIKKLNTYCEMAGLDEDSWIWDEELFKERELINVEYEGDFTD